jgi:hypothetical protein
MAGNLLSFAITIRLIESITMYVIFYQCSSQLCPLAYHFNITIINISAPYTAYISWAAPKIYYSLVHASAVFREISCNIIILVLVLQDPKYDQRLQFAIAGTNPAHVYDVCYGHFLFFELKLELHPRCKVAGSPRRRSKGSHDKGPYHVFRG